MPGSHRLLPLKHFCASLLLLLGLFGCSASRPPTRPADSAPIAPTAPRAPAVTVPRVTQTIASSAPIYPVMLGIDVLESEGFAAIKSKRIGLLTHPAGVNRRGERTIDVLRRAPAGDPTVYLIDGMEIALRHETAESIRVRPPELEA